MSALHPSKTSKNLSQPINMDEFVKQQTHVVKSNTKLFEKIVAAGDLAGRVRFLAIRWIAEVGKNASSSFDFFYFFHLQGFIVHLLTFTS